MCHLFLNPSFTEIQQTHLWIHSPTLFLCEYKSAVRFVFFLHILPSEAGQLHQPVVPLSGSQPETAQSSPRCLSPSWHSFQKTPAPFSFFSLFLYFYYYYFFLIQDSTFLQSVRNAVSGAHTHTRCAIWISVFVAKQLASKGFQYKSKSLPVMQLSRL